MTDTAWATEPADPVEATKAKFRPSLVARAEKREVEKAGDGWLVVGEPKLGDTYLEYEVGLVDGRRYSCSCYSHMGGDHRRHKVCSHVLAVILWRKKERAKEQAVEAARARIAARAVSNLGGGGDWEVTPSTARAVAGSSPASVDPSSELLGGTASPPASWGEGEPADPGVVTPGEGAPPSPRDPMFGLPPLPDRFDSFRDVQWEAIQKIVAAFERGAKVVFCQAPTGCLAADTMINLNRGGNSRGLPLAALCAMWAGSETVKGRGVRVKWDLSIPTMVQRADDGIVRLGLLSGAWYSGIKETFTLTTKAGRTIRATTEHPFLTPTGWVPLGGLSIGDEVLTNVGQGGSERKPKSWYRLVNGLRAHPFAGRRGVNPTKGGFSVPMHRLVAEAAANGLAVEHFVDLLRAGAIEGLIFLDPKVFAVHHRDGDHRNNSPENLEVLTHEDHHRRHADDGASRHVAHRIDADIVTSIDRFGMEPTFDLSVADDPHNFIANEFVVHNTGKTLLGEASRRLVGGRAVYIATTKALQDQALDSFPYATILKGRSNYTPTGTSTTNLWGERVSQTKKDSIAVTCADCTRQPGDPSCRWCSDVTVCPYTTAKNRAVASDLAVLNTAYFLADSNLGPRKFADRELCVIDEADTLEGELMGLVEVRISRGRMRALKLDPPAKKTVESSWGEWVDETAIPRVRQALGMLPPVDSPAATPRQIREAKSLANLLESLKLLSSELADDPAAWVYDGYAKGEVVFRPVRVAKFGERFVWRHAKRFLLMSATIISAQEMAESLGLEGEYAVVDVPMTFPVENRQVKVVPIAEMTNKNAEKAWPKMAGAIVKLLPMHPGERVLIHTVSYKLADYLWTEVKNGCPGRPVFRYGNSGEKDQALQRYLRTEGAVLIAPSMDRGVDLPGDACRVQVVAKVPFPNLGDKQVNKRLYTRGGQEWYAVQTVRSLVQMTGRGVRSPEDFAVTYVFDHSFTSNIWRKSRMLLPKWWVEAIDWRTDPRRFIAG